jgi:L-ascorbate metabolism protein UlaG (beta-lactamase superfamily)
MTHKFALGRRTFLAGAAALGSVTLLPYAARAAAHAYDVFTTPAGDIQVFPIGHASFVMKTPKGVVYNDPVGDVADYSEFPTPDMILVTHEHGDHFNADTLNGVMGDNTILVTNPAVFDELPVALQARATVMANGARGEGMGVGIEAIPAYNLTEDRQKFHPQGRDNGYVLSLGGFRIYISGDTEGIPEMRALENIDLAFVCMNLPFTMDAEAAADAVSDFKPTYCYPYHFRGRGDGTQDPAVFAAAVNEAVQVKLGGWY